MNSSILQDILCPVNFDRSLDYRILIGDEQDVVDAILWNPATRDWYYVENRLLDLLPGAFAYQSERDAFYQKHLKTFEEIELENRKLSDVRPDHEEDVLIQQKHFDEYSNSEKQTYSEYESSPFWRATDKLAFDRWIKEIETTASPGAKLIDIGSAQGRSCQYFQDMDLEIVGCDISKDCLREAVKRYRDIETTARYHFIACDCSRLPFKNQCFDFALVYGVLHHLPEPGKTCGEIIRILKPDGRYFGSENNKSPVRFIFDLLQLLKPQWYELAGSSPLIGRKDFNIWFSGFSDITISYLYSVYLPPHLVNLFGKKVATTLIKFTDGVFSKIPFLKQFGGLITLVVRKNA